MAITGHTPRVYYNDHDRFSVAWLRALIAAGALPPGDVDDRSILDVRADDIKAYDHCHFFAGIGGWPYALELAGWRGPVWTGSCPCQPLSSAGQRKGHADERHLWPAFYALIAERRPATVFGEQVASRDGYEWLAGVRADMEAARYALGAADLAAAGVGAPHIRQRLYWVAHALCGRAIDGPGEGMGAQAAPDGADGRLPRERLRAGIEGAAGELAHADGRDRGDGNLQRSWQQRQQPQDGGAGRLALAASAGWRAQPERSDRADGRPAPEPRRLCDAGALADAEIAGRNGRPDAGANGAASAAGAGERRQPTGRVEPAGEGEAGPMGDVGGPWAGAIWLPCRDGKARRVEPGIFPLAHGIPGRVGRLRGYGNAIVPPLAAKFVSAFMALQNA